MYPPIPWETTEAGEAVNAYQRLVEALRDAAIELDNLHREYLAGRHGGCPCLGGIEACQLGAALDQARTMLAEIEAKEPTL